MDIRIYKYIPITEVEGPGKRFCLWVQGCSIRCEGCANKHLWDKNKGVLSGVEDILAVIEEYKNEIEGVTILGGEPLDQIDAVSYLSKKVKEMGLTVLLFTGYNYPDLIKDEKFTELIKYVDILIDGKYDKNQADYSRPWVGSKNQNYYFLTDAYDESVLNKYKNKVEIRVQNGKIIMSGMTDLSEILNVK